MDEDPIASALIICDDIIRDVHRGNPSLINMFSTIVCHDLPHTHPKMCVYASLTNGRGKLELQLSCVSERGSKKLVELRGEVLFESPDQTVDMEFHLNNLIFSEHGLYTFELRTQDMLLIEKRFNIAMLK